MEKRFIRDILFSSLKKFLELHLHICNKPFEIPHIYILLWVFEVRFPPETLKHRNSPTGPNEREKRTQKSCLE